jgi:hypothetical protein
MAHNRRPKFSSLIRYRVAVATALVFSLTGAFASGADVNISELQKAASKGTISKEIELAEDYIVGRGVPKDAKMAAFWYEKAALSGDPEAENEIGFFYQTGAGVPVDMNRAVHWYQLASASGLALAKVNLGVMYCWGIGVQKDEKLGAQLFREAAEKGSGVASTYLGNMYYFGQGVNQDRAAAETWYAKGVKMHEPMAEYNMASLLTVSRDHPHNLSQGVKLLRESAGAGYVPAMHSLGVLLTNHPELTSSPQEARTLLETAANAGWWKSSVVLGILARNGVGDSPGPESAYYHFQIAILQGGEPAKLLLAKDLVALSGKLEEKKRNALTSDANSWFSQHKTALDFVFNAREHAKQFPWSALTLPAEDVHAGILVPTPPS